MGPDLQLFGETTLKVN